MSTVEMGTVKVGLECIIAARYRTNAETASERRPWCDNSLACHNEKPSKTRGHGIGKQSLPDEEILARLLALNLARAGGTSRPKI